MCVCVFVRLSFLVTPFKQLETKKYDNIRQFVLLIYMLEEMVNGVLGSEGTI